MLDQLKMIKQAHDLQKKMKELKCTVEYDGVSVEINGKFDILSLSIDENLLTDKTKLEKTVKQAMNNAIAEAQKKTAESMRGEIGGLFGA